MNTSNSYTSSTSSSAPIVERVLLPTQVIEKPVAIHEEIRKETIEEVQPIFNVEKLKTEIHQVTQPLFDKEVRSVNIENRTLAPEILPEVLVQGRGARTAEEMSTTQYMDTQTVVVEKPAMVREVEKRQIIEEIQPVIYKETVVPTVIQETKPIFQKIVEGPVYTQETLASRSVANPSIIQPAYVPDTTVIAPINERMMLPTQVIERPVAVHETIRKEMIEEIQPVVNVEKLKTEVHQVTQPLFDKEIKPVMVERRILNQEVLPEVQVMGRGARAVEDVSTTQFMDTKTVLVEKPAIFNEVERTQIIEEIQPVVYKETVVPTVIRETKPIFQKIVEGPVYTHQTLPAQSLQGSHYSYPTQQAPLMTQPIMSQPIMSQPVMAPREVIPIVDTARVVPVPVVVAPVVTAPVVLPVQEHHRKEIITDTVTTTTTTSVAPTLGAHPMTHEKKHHSLFHRHDKTQDAHHTNNTIVNQTLPTGDRHVERLGPNGEKIVEDVHTTTSHSQRTIPLV